MGLTSKTDGRSAYFTLSLMIVMVVAFGFGQTIDNALINAPSPRPWILGTAMPLVAIGAVFAMKHLHDAEGHVASVTSLVVPLFEMLAFSTSFALAIR
jgi:hypothetical protein